MIHDVSLETPPHDTVEEVIVADVDDVPVANSRPRRANVGAGVERLQMEFQGKGYQAKREYNFTTNSVQTQERKVKWVTA